MKGAVACLETKKILQKRLVSKNVCHGLIYSPNMHERFSKYVGKGNLGLDIIYEGMEVYLSKNRGGKKFHDVLAAAAAVCPEVVKSKPVKMYNTKKGWGGKFMVGSDTTISVYCDHQLFFKILVGLV